MAARDFVTAVYKDGPRKGQKRIIPAHWLDDPNGLGAPYRLTPSNRARKERQEANATNGVSDGLLPDAQSGRTTEPPATSGRDKAGDQSASTQTPRDGDSHEGVSA